VEAQDYKDVRNPGSQRRILGLVLGLHPWDTNGTERTLTYPVDENGNMVTGEWGD